MSRWSDLTHVEFLGNDLKTWVIALGIFLVTFTILPLLRSALSAQRRRRTDLSAVHFTDLAAELVARTSRTFLFAAAVWLAARDLSFPPKLERALTVVIVLLFWMQAARWTMTAVRYSIDVRRRRSAGPDTLLKSSMEVILFAAGILIWGIAALLALDNLGVQVAPLLAGLGIGGIALALAVQAVLGDLLASLSIALDKPFGLGDALTVDDVQGTVEHIGVKSTRLRSVNGEQIILSNADILKSRVRNFGRLRERRSLFRLEVHYETPVPALAAVPRVVREIIEATPETRFERCHLLSCGGPALQFEVVYFVTNPQYRAYADAQQSINLRILERFSALGVSFMGATPTQVRLHQPAPATPDAGAQARLL
ncbi:MAG TPA: mechanosensitive ion channel family protein [Steroidobacteraceae bacterium]|nr:mechanosensitive ion channel family protein [Steroidobacteraceae bacterium]